MLGNRLKKHVRNVTRIKYGFPKSVVIFLLLTQDVIMWLLPFISKNKQKKELLHLQNG